MLSIILICLMYHLDVIDLGWGHTGFLLLEWDTYRNKHAVFTGKKILGFTSKTTMKFRVFSSYQPTEQDVMTNEPMVAKIFFW